MRLTLRTLLAYLDDTLPAAEIKGIGQKVAESDAAQELVARIKQVTRRRRLTTPPATGPNARFDANDVADYLDNELATDKMADLEKICLESDAHLAEIAACHQILTLVLGEPALVPPTAKERMYGLVHGREAIPFRKAPAPGSSTANTPGSEEEDDLLGLHFLRRGSRWRWVLPIAGLLLFVALGVAIWQSLPDNRRPGPGPKQPGPEGALTPQETQAKKPENGKPVKKPKDKVEPIVVKPKAEGKDKKVKGGKKGKEVEDDEVKRVPPPSTKRVVAGRYIGGGAFPSLLAAREDGQEWRRVLPSGQVSTTDALVSMPGFVSEIVTKKDGGVSLLMRGNLREFVTIELMQYLMESAVVLHENPEFDLDLTLSRGRIYLRNRNRTGPVKVRLRFDKEAWDLKMEKGTEIAVDLLRAYARDIKYREGEPPRSELYLFVLRGEAELTVDAFHTHYLEGPPGQAMFAWDNATRAHGPIRFTKAPPAWDKVPNSELVKPMEVAMRGLLERLKGMKGLDVALRETQESEVVYSRLLALYCYTAIDDVGQLIAALRDEEQSHYPDRETAIFCLRRWLARAPGQMRLLYDAKTKSGALIDAKYTSGRAQTILELLFDYPDEQRRDPDTFLYLAGFLDKDTASAELAYWHLLRLSFPVKLPAFNAGDAVGQRKMVADQVARLVMGGKLPPMPMAKPKPPDEP